jgi:hypothetical protein
MAQCAQLTRRNERCTRSATWMRSRWGGTELFCTQHANEHISPDGRRRRPESWTRLAAMTTFTRLTEAQRRTLMRVHERAPLYGPDLTVAHNLLQKGLIERRNQNRTWREFALTNRGYRALLGRPGLDLGTGR